MTQSTDQGTIWLTQDAFDKLHGRARGPQGPARQEIIERISAARDEGDLKENGGYHAAKDEQGKIEARIRQLEDMLRRAEVGETPPTTASSSPGMVVTYRFVGDDETEKFLLGAREIERDDDRSRSTPRSPPWARRSTASPRATPSSYAAPNGKRAQGRDRRRRALHRLTPYRRSSTVSARRERRSAYSCQSRRVGYS